MSTSEDLADLKAPEVLVAHRVRMAPPAKRVLAELGAPRANEGPSA